jgi:hypothetical protein
MNNIKTFLDILVSLGTLISLCFSIQYFRDYRNRKKAMKIKDISLLMQQFEISEYFKQNFVDEEAARKFNKNEEKIFLFFVKLEIKIQNISDEDLVIESILYGNDQYHNTIIPANPIIINHSLDQKITSTIVFYDSLSLLDVGEYLNKNDLLQLGGSKINKIVDRFESIIIKTKRKNIYHKLKRNNIEKKLSIGMQIIGREELIRIAKSTIKKFARGITSTQQNFS